MDRMVWPLTLVLRTVCIWPRGQEPPGCTETAEGYLFQMMAERPGDRRSIVTATFTTSRLIRVTQKFCTPPVSNLPPGARSIAVSIGRVFLGSISSGDIA